MRWLSYGGMNAGQAGDRLGGWRMAVTDGKPHDGLKILRFSRSPLVWPLALSKVLFFFCPSRNPFHAITPLRFLPLLGETQLGRLINWQTTLTRKPAGDPFICT